ncbi:3TM-type holin [Roseospirillum parvum]|uniref:Holin of 3TMs, for gene-transfer release n=1 Tax=Roseospirillum parvum TaxID=83401 RepID=A0A1G7U774_9PROT|nr:3TM-type holin [Roseospirillum parvum]SDG43228.1 Holin of 3TMs, for gene-transfer release [Roseospirillum parvum]
MIPAIIGALAAIAPSVIKWATDDDDAVKVAEQVGGIARRLAGSDDTEAAIKAIEADPRLHLDFQRAYLDWEFGMYRAETERLQIINRTVRAEVASQDAYVRRMRPTFGYIMAASWAVQMGALGYTIVTAPELAGEVITAMASLSTIWSVGLAVLGVYVYKRSAEKQPPSAEQLGILSALARRVAGPAGT